MQEEVNTQKATEIIAKYCLRLPREISQIVDMLEAGMNRASENQSLVEELHSEVHRMAGSAMCMGFPFLGQELSAIEADLRSMANSPTPASLHELFEITQKIEAIARLCGYTTPENSVLLRSQQAKAEKLGQSRTQVSERYRVLMQEQRILFADDDQSIRMLMRDILLNIGVSGVEIASNGHDMISKLRHFCPTAIITDWHMAPMDGLEFLRQLRSGALEVAADLPVVFLSSRQTINHVQSAIDAGVDHFLAKPFSIGLVEKAIYQLITRKRQKKPIDEADVVYI